MFNTNISNYLKEKVIANSFYKGVSQIVELENLIIVESRPEGNVINYTPFTKDCKRLGVTYQGFEEAVIGGLAIINDGFNTQADEMFYRMIKKV